MLRNRLKELPSVTTLFGWTAQRIDQDDRGASVTIVPTDEGAFYSWSADAQQMPTKAPAPGSQRVIRADYLVGCDGGRSLVRESMGIDRAGRDFDQRMVAASKCCLQITLEQRGERLRGVPLRVLRRERLDAIKRKIQLHRHWLLAP